MKPSFHHMRARSRESGAAMIELAIVAPLFLLLILAVVDLSMAVNTHGQLVQIVREGLRASSNLAYLEPDQWELEVSGGAETFKLNAAAVAVNAVSPQAQVRLLAAIQRMIQAKATQLRIDMQNYRIRSRVDYAAPGAPPYPLTIEIDSNYSGIFTGSGSIPVFGQVPIRVSSIGPYTS